MNPQTMPRLRKLYTVPPFIIVRGIDNNVWFVCKHVDRGPDMPPIFYIESFHHFLQAAEAELAACEEAQKEL